MLLCVVSFSSALFAQNATDFTTDDCNGISHTLFDELDNGDVIVICWVMPCNPCATYAGYASDAVQSFAISHPGKVKYYLADDYANSTCSYIDDWASNYNLVTDASFSSSDLDMLDYGQLGMPKVVVLGGSNHFVFYNKNDNQIDFNGVQAAIVDALSGSVGIKNQEKNKLGLSIYPNPTNGTLNIKYEVDNLNKTKFEIVNILGEKLIYANGDNTFSSLVGLKIVDINTLENGIYFLNASSGTNVNTLRFIVTDN